MPTPAGEDELYALPLEEFTAGRNALAKELGKRGDKAAAADVKRLTKPSRTAWALNQLARRQPEAIDELLVVGERLREAQEQALAGDASQLRGANRAEQEQVDHLAEAALELLGTSDGATRDRLRKTLRAAAVDPDTGALLRRGRLLSDVEPSGFGLDGLSADIVPRTPARKPPAPAVDKSEREDEDREAARARQDEEREAARLRRQQLREARQEAERLRKEAETQQRRARRLADEAERAQQQAHEARLAAEEAVSAASAAQRAADEAAARVAALEEG